MITTPRYRISWGRLDRAASALRRLFCEEGRVEYKPDT